MTLHTRSRPGRLHARILVSATLGVLPLAGRADPPPASASTLQMPAPPRLPRESALPAVALPTSAEPDGLATGSALANPFSRAATAAVTTGQALTAPVTLNAKTSADALTVTQTGAGRAINATASNAASTMSAVRGIANGQGSGVNGVHSGLNGQAGKFEITNAASYQPSLLVTTDGTGSALQAIVKGKSLADRPAVLGQNNVSPVNGVGVQGEGGNIGVVGKGTFYGVVGRTNDGYGVYGTSVSNVGTYGRSDKTSGVLGVSAHGAGVTGLSGSGPGLEGKSYSLDANSFGVTGFSEHYAGVYGQSNVAIGVYGYSQSNFGVVGRSDTNYAGVFYGPVSVSSRMSIGGAATVGGALTVSGTVLAASYGYTSDRDQKQGFAPVDATDVLSRVAAMPITTWDYKARPAERHIGPMAQDFHAAFGLGADERHIDVVDGIGVSLAAIQELQRQLQQKSLRIDALEAQVQQRSARVDTLEEQMLALRTTVEARLAAVEQAAQTASTSAQR